jgi:nucleotide-binding universal stress UspA family protein
MTSIRRRKFLVVADDTPESRVALRFAARRAEHTGGVVSIAYVVATPGTQTWRAVEEKMRDEALADAESTLYSAARYAFDITATPAEIVTLEGKKKDALLALIKADRDISVLVLASGAGRDGPGPLVAAAATGAKGFPIPVTIVPGNLRESEIDAIA